MIQIDWLNAKQQHYLSKCYSLHCISQPYPWSEAIFNDMLSKPYRIAVLTSQEIVLGYVVVLVVADEMTIMDIAVTPQERGKGHAKQLLINAIQYAEDCHCKKVLLEVRFSNHAAICLYKSLSFDIIAERKNYYPGISRKEQKEDAIIMALSLDTQ